MMVISSLNDHLRLLLSSDYKISDSDYKLLSEILVSNDVESIAFDSGLVQIIKILHETGLKFPMTINFLQYKWKENFIEYNFVKSFIPLVSNGLFRLIHMGKETLKKRSDTITYDMNLEEMNQEKFVVVYSTPEFDVLYDQVSEVLSKYKFKLNSYIGEEVEIAPKKIRDSIEKLNKLLSRMSIKVSIESYIKDESVQEDEISLVISNISDYKMSNRDLEKFVRRYLDKVYYVMSVDAYKEVNNEMYIEITTKSQSSYSELTTALFNMINDLEVNSSQSE